MFLTAAPFQFGPEGSCMVLAPTLKAFCVIAPGFKAQNNDVSTVGAGT